NYVVGIGVEHPLTEPSAGDCPTQGVRLPLRQPGQIVESGHGVVIEVKDDFADVAADAQILDSRGIDQSLKDSGCGRLRAPLRAVENEDRPGDLRDGRDHQPDQEKEKVVFGPDVQKVQQLLEPAAPQRKRKRQLVIELPEQNRWVVDYLPF